MTKKDLLRLLKPFQNGTEILIVGFNYKDDAELDEYPIVDITEMDDDGSVVCLIKVDSSGIVFED